MLTKRLMLVFCGLLIACEEKDAEIIDVDSDGIAAVDDCDDNDSTLGNRTLDQDCDGTVTADDCDDSDSASTVVAAQIES